MFDQPGIGVDDLPRIHRDQFSHYVKLAYSLCDPDDWPGLREDLLGALTAALGLAAETVAAEGLTPGQRRALKVLDQVRGQHDPGTNWPAFFDMLWSRRHAIRPDCH